MPAINSRPSFLLNPLHQVNNMRTSSGLSRGSEMSADPWVRHRIEPILMHSFLPVPCRGKTNNGLKNRGDDRENRQENIVVSRQQTRVILKCLVPVGPGPNASGYIFRDRPGHHPTSLSHNHDTRIPQMISGIFAQNTCQAGLPQRSVRPLEHPSRRNLTLLIKHLRMHTPAGYAGRHS